jgi:hypothetical protein
MLRLVLRRLMFSKVVLVVYIVVGVIVANSHHYFTHVSGARSVISAALAVVLWPLVLFGVNVHIK